MKLYELSDSFNAVFDLLNDEDVDLQTLEDTLQAIEGAAYDKIDGCVRMIKSLDAAAEKFAEEAARLERKKKAFENRSAWLKSYVEACMREMGKDKVDISIGTVRRQKSLASVQISNPAVIPEQYLIIPPPPRPQPDKKAILNALKAGKEVPGCTLYQGYHIRVY